MGKERKLRKRRSDEKKNEIKKRTELQQFNNFVLFETENGKVNIDVFFQDETLWLTQKLIAELFEKGRSTLTGHLKRFLMMVS